MSPDQARSQSLIAGEMKFTFQDVQLLLSMDVVFCIVSVGICSQVGAAWDLFRVVC